jgi:hypothetical protein
MKPSLQFLRVAQIVIGKNGNGIKVDQKLKIQFEIIKTVDPEPNQAIVKIYNLNQTNEEKIKNEYDEIIINAGYQDASRLIFRGNIIRVFRYRDKTDFITEIEAGDGDKDFRNAIMNETLAAGTSTSQLVDRAVKSFSSTLKGESQVQNKQRLRGKVISGNTRDILSDIAAENGANWSIQDGQLQIVKTDGVLPDEAIVVNSNTGMLGSPEINDKGIAVQALLNPQFRVNGVIKLDNNVIRAKRANRATLANSTERDALKAEKNPVRLDPDGLYKILKITHKGDTRGTGGDWVTDIECIGITQKLPSSRKS